MEICMAQKMCFYNVLRGPKTPFSSCELVGSFKTEGEAKKRMDETNKKIDHQAFLIQIHKLEYEA
jgi:hypothetical protein